mmetsp:Transcript_21071/g.25903  ORF Transcript_21071/g.25903 Transcript_21071/m.25903 type:complete len:228 (-) Transcript_21071:598-1281(-)
MNENNSEKTQAGVSYLYRTGDKVPENVTEIIMDNSITEIPNMAFTNFICGLIEKIKLPEGLKIIGEFAFDGCEKLREMNFPASLETIDCGAFCGCQSLKEVKLSPSLKRINHSAFFGCTSLIITNFPPSLEVIDEYAFHGCTSLTAIFFPNSLQRIGTGAFSECTSLISAELPPTVQVADDAFRDCHTLELRYLRVDFSSLTQEQVVQRSRETTRYLKERFDRLSNT